MSLTCLVCVRMQAAFDAQQVYAASLSVAVKTHFLCPTSVCFTFFTNLCLSVISSLPDHHTYKARLQAGDRSALLSFPTFF